LDEVRIDGTVVPSWDFLLPEPGAALLLLAAVPLLVFRRRS